MLWLLLHFIQMEENKKVTSNPHLKQLKEQLLLLAQKPRKRRKIADKEKWKIKFLLNISEFAKKKNKNQSIKH